MIARPFQFHFCASVTLTFKRERSFRLGADSASPVRLEAQAGIYQESNQFWTHCRKLPQVLFGGGRPVIPFQVVWKRRSLPPCGDPGAIG